MKVSERKAIMLQHRQRHIESLKKLGYTRDTLHAIKQLENEAHKLTTDACNGKISDVEYSDAEMRLSNRVAMLFGGKLPKGFFINGDPRGYALKLDAEAWKVSDNAQENYEALPIKYQDWGGYMILAPEEF